MFKILQKTVRTGIVTTAYPKRPGRAFRAASAARPSSTSPIWRDARPAAEVCPTGAIAVRDSGGHAARHGRLRPLHLLRRVRRRADRGACA